MEEGPYWDRLLATKVKQPWLRIDFKNWKDEDDDEEEGQGQDIGQFACWEGELIVDVDDGLFQRR